MGHKMGKFIAVFIFCLAIFVSLAHTANANEDICLPVLTQAGHDIADSYGQQTADFAQAESFCDESLSERSQDSSSSIAVSYELFAANHAEAGRTIEDFRHNYCEDGHTTWHSNSISQTHVVRVYHDSVLAWLDCERLAKNYYEIIPKISRIGQTLQEVGLDVSLRYAGGQGPGQFQGVSIRPLGAFECVDETGAPMSRFLHRDISVKAWTFSCDRIIKTIGGTKLAPPAQIVIKTTAPPPDNLLSIDFEDMAVPDLRDRNAQELSARINQLETRISRLETGSHAHLNLQEGGLGGVGAFENKGGLWLATCPDSTVAVGLRLSAAIGYKLPPGDAQALINLSGVTEARDHPLELLQLDCAPLIWQNGGDSAIVSPAASR